MSKYFDTNNMDEKDKEFVDKLDGLVDIFNEWFMGYIKAKDYKNIEKMIKDGYKVDFEINSMSPLMLASFMNEKYIIELLLNAGADINKGYKRNDSIYNTPLRCSIYAFLGNGTTEPTGKIDTVQLLLDHGAKYDDIDLEYAKRSFELQNLLSQYKANYCEKCNQPDDIDTMMDMFVNNIIAKNTSYNNLDDEMKESVNKAFLYYIGKKDKTKELESLINFGVNLDFEYDSYTPLMKAVMLNDIYTIKLLLKRYVNINKSLLVDDCSFTALNMALMNYQNYNKTDVIELLLQNGASYSEKDLAIIIRFELQKLFSKYINNATEEAKLSSLFNSISFYNSSVYKEAETGFNDFINKIESNRKAKENQSSNDKGACYVATAVYGDYNCPQVMVLRNFRNNYLLKHKVGKIFVKYYYKYSPNFVRKFKKYKAINNILRFTLDNFVRLLRCFNY